MQGGSASTRSTPTGRRVRYRADERFLLCSTGKALPSPPSSSEAEGDPALLDRVIPYGPSDVLE